jgi:phosphoribosylanthranilate isomerase
MKIKVCGNTVASTGKCALMSLGVTFAGFIFYPKSPRYYGAENKPGKNATDQRENN